jgi:hypothetical protein
MIHLYGAVGGLYSGASEWAVPVMQANYMPEGGGGVRRGHSLCL